MYLLFYLAFAGFVMLILVLQSTSDQTKVNFKVNKQELKQHVDTEMERINTTLDKINTNYAKRNIKK
jgi:uncharacterized protein YpmS